MNNFVFLARQKFYDGLLVHRAVKDFVFQTGSPSNTQDGGPGYTVKGEVPTTTPAYPVGSVAFGKTGADPAGTAGSQFFVVTGSGNADLPADYAFLGTVTRASTSPRRSRPRPGQRRRPAHEEGHGEEGDHHRGVGGHEHDRGAHHGRAVTRRRPT